MAKRGPKLKGPVTKEDWDTFEKLLGMQCTLEEIAGFYSVDVKTIQTRVEEHYEQKFSLVFEQKRNAGKISLRRKQFQKAIEGGGNVPMLIWLGKQYLGQKDNIEIDTNPKNPFEGLSLDDLQSEIDRRTNRLAGVKLKSRDISGYEREIIEKSKK